MPTTVSCNAKNTKEQGYVCTELLSHMLLCLCVPVPGVLWKCGLFVQFVCSLCLKWRSVKRKHGTICNDCHYEQQSLRAHPPLPPSPPPHVSPPPPLFDRPSGCIDQLTLVERAAIITLDKIGHSRSEIAQEMG